MWRSEGSFAERFSPCAWSPMVTAVVGAHSSPTDPQLPAGFSFPACISAGVLRLCAGVQGPDPSCQVCTESAFTREPLHGPEFWLFFSNMALFSLFVGSFISYMFDDIIFNVMTPSKSLSWSVSTHQLTWVSSWVPSSWIPVILSCLSCWLDCLSPHSRPHFLRTRTMSY